MSWYPKAARKQLARDNGERTILRAVAVTPCASTKPSLVVEYRDQPDAVPHLFVRSTGHVEQYRPCGDRPTVVIATQGDDPMSTMDPRQAAAIEEVKAWAEALIAPAESAEASASAAPVEADTEPQESSEGPTEALPLVWLHGPDGCDNCELRWSMRAITAHVPPNGVWIVGYAPPWVDRDKVRVIEVPSTDRPRPWGKHHQLNTALLAACEQIPGRFLVCHDDHFAVRAPGPIEPVHRGQGSLPRETARLERREGKSVWTRNHRQTLDHLLGLGYDPGSLASYEIHRPMLVEGAALKEMLEAAPAHPQVAVLYKTLYGNLAGVGGAKQSDHKAQDVERTVPDGSTWVSTNATSFAGAIGDELRELYPDPSPYERTDLPAPTFEAPEAAGLVEVLLPTTVPGGKDGGTGQVSRMQAWLNTLGYACGQPPGHYGTRTRRAVAKFQDDNGCKCGGKIKAEKFLLLQKLAAQAAAAGTAKIVHPHQATGLSSRPAGTHLELLAKAVPADQAIVELGVFHGRTLLYLARGSAVGNRAPVHGFDPWDLPGERYPSAWRAEKRHRSTFTHTETRESAEANVAKSPWAELITLGRAFSVDAAADWAGPKVGLLHIDGNHNYPDAMADFLAWQPHLAPGATVVWDDWDIKHPGVQQSVNELVERGQLTPPQSAPGVARLAVTTSISAD